MSATDTAKDVIRIATTAGLSKDVIDLLEKKSALLTEQVMTLERENTQLKLEVAQLRAQLKNSQPVTGSFREFEGVLWKHTASGIGKTPYCPQCSDNPIMFGQPPMGMGRDPMLWQCSKCGFKAPFAGRPVS
jgi:predicted RNA-binding Zn-ribbon protein involved in translation (DUF1610 family)